MLRRFSRAALIAGLAVGASGLAAVPAEAANSITTPTYYVNNPSIGHAWNVTPGSAVVSASIDTGGSPESLLPVPSGGLSWSAPAAITISSEVWNDGVAPTASTSGDYAPVDGLPVSGSSSDVSVTVTDTAITNSGVSDPGIGAQSGVPQTISNADADNYSDVTFEYDPVSDYVANGGQPGSETDSASDLQIPTQAGLTSVSTTLGAFGLAAESSTGNTPLKPGTKYYYWVTQQPGATDQATNVNVSAWSGNLTDGQPGNNVFDCLPNVVIAADPTLEKYVQSNASITYGGTTVGAVQGPCIYHYGDTNGQVSYQSPNGEFTTAKLGKLVIGQKAKAVGSGAALTVTDASAFKASGTITLSTKAGTTLGTAKFALRPSAKGSVNVKLTSAGRKALMSEAAAKLVLTSNWGQLASRKSVKL